MNDEQHNGVIRSRTASSRAGERAVSDLFGTRFNRRGESVRHDIEVEFVTRYAIPKATIDALTFFLSEISPRTVAAMQNFVHLPDLF